MPVDIHGKTYTTVAERRKSMSEEANNKYSLTTDVIEHTGELWVVKATLTITGRGTFVGHCQQKESAKRIGKRSALECCETLAIGRALASAGYHSTEFCSAEEIAQALINESIDYKATYEKVTKPQLDLINKLIKELGLEAKRGAWLKKNNIEKIEDCSKEKAKEAITKLLAIQEKAKQKT